MRCKSHKFLFAPCKYLFKHIVGLQILLDGSLKSSSSSWKLFEGLHAHDCQLESYHELRIIAHYRRYYWLMCLCLLVARIQSVGESSIEPCKVDVTGCICIIWSIIDYFSCIYRLWVSAMSNYGCWMLPKWLSSNFIFPSFLILTLSSILIS